MFTIQMNEQQLQNLKAFLLRADLKGTEVGAFAEVLGIVNGAAKVDKETKKVGE